MKGRMEEGVREGGDGEREERKEGDGEREVRWA